MKMEIKKGDSVRIKPGVTDPDYEYEISGWQGRVTNIDTDEIKIIEIAWDSVTLNQMPAELIEASIEEGFDFSLMWLNGNEVDLTEPRDLQQAVEQRIEALNEQFGYISSDEQSKNIAQILDSKDTCILTGSEDFSWEEPYVFGVFDKEEYERLKKKRASYTDHFKLVKLEDIIDDLRGIMVKVKRIGDKKVFVLPLWDLETTDRKDKNQQLFVDYSYWMSNYR